jgi:hypothetical protein
MLSGGFHRKDFSGLSVSDLAVRDPIALRPHFVEMVLAIESTQLSQLN